MITRPELTDETVAAAIDGSKTAVERLAAVMSDRLKLMVHARLDPSAAQLDLVEEITQQSMEALLRGLPDLQIRTAAGIRAYASKIVARRVADQLRDPGGIGRGRKPPVSLDSTFAGQSTAGPLWQFLSITVTSPSSEAVREDQFRRAMVELNHLPAEYRAVITLAFFDQLSMTLQGGSIASLQTSRTCNPLSTRSSGRRISVWACTTTPTPILVVLPKVAALAWDLSTRKPLQQCTTWQGFGWIRASLTRQERCTPGRWKHDVTCLVTNIPTRSFQ